MKVNKDFFLTKGKIIESINRKQFRIECDNGMIIIADVAARFRNERGGKRAKIVFGDKVAVEIPLRDPEKGQIVSMVE
jgi:translation initiation factor IF-1